MDVVIAPGLEEVSPEDWDALIGEDNPFLEHAFLRLLETSGSVGEAAGWLPLHVLVEDDGKLIGAAPCYLKDNSYGEYIFDWGFADAAARAGLPYYPKLVCAVPFTPATGPRLLVHPDADRERVWAALVAGFDALMRETGAWSVHVLYCLDDEAAFLDQAGLSRRATHQFHWRNDGYADFDAFLDALRSSNRKQIRRERRKVTEAGLDVELRWGNTLSDEEWRTLHQLYQSTGARKWGSPYLTRGFFRDGRERVGHSALIAFARRDQEIVAGTLSFARGKHLYGRYWGTFEPRERDCVHFELCYYRLVQHAIENGMTLVEAGAQGEHKVKRGFLPVVTHSAHRFAHPGLADAIAEHLAVEREGIQHEVDKWYQQGPFKDGCAPQLPAVAGIRLSVDRSQDPASDPSGPT